MGRRQWLGNLGTRHKQELTRAATPADLTVG
jgi:hypothetical protein